ncbi:MAG: aminoacyl-tRNA hydrolase [Balneolales bacterium]|nr:aminoacyl-tRNA hydrolase [Balneolales bacterium]
MIIIVGLGNPGKEYTDTRHNIGFKIVDAIADKAGASFESKSSLYKHAETSVIGRRVCLVKPQTYMNRSGSAVKKILGLYKKLPSEILVCYDDLHLPSGKIRFKPSGSAAGHNGIKDIIAETNTQQFNRLRFGIGDNFGRGQQSDYVLSPFDPAEEAEVQTGIDKAVEGVLFYIRNGMVKTMNLYN